MVVVTAVTGPLVGYEVGKRMGDRLFTSRRLNRVSGVLDWALAGLRDRGGVVWGVGYSLLGYLAGSAYGVVERTVGTGLAIAVAVVVVALVAIWALRWHRSVASRPSSDVGEAGPASGSA